MGAKTLGAVFALAFMGQASAADRDKLPIDNMRCLAASAFLAENETSDALRFAHFTYYLGRIDEGTPGRATVKQMRTTLRPLTGVDLIADALRCKQAYAAREGDMEKLIDEVNRWIEREGQRVARERALKSFNEDDQR